MKMTCILYLEKKIHPTKHVKVIKIRETFDFALFLRLPMECFPVLYEEMLILSPKFASDIRLLLHLLPSIGSVGLLAQLTRNYCLNELNHAFAGKKSLQKVHLEDVVRACCGEFEPLFSAVYCITRCSLLTKNGKLPKGLLVSSGPADRKLEAR